MIVSRSLFRGADLAWKFTTAFVIPKNPKAKVYCQGYRSYYGLSYTRKMDRGKLIPTAMNTGKKHKSSNSFWRPSCQTNFDEDLAEPVNVDVGTFVDNATVSAGKYTYSVEVGASLMRFIRGKGGSTQKEIEKEMGVKILFPSSKEEESIMIEGMSVESVNRASDKIQSVIDEVVKSRSLDYSHFVSLPLAVNSELVDKLINFQNFVLGSSGQVSNAGSKEHAGMDIENLPTTSYPPKASKSPSLSGNVSVARGCDLGIDKSIFINPKTFHLTVLMLKLWKKEQVDTASEVLKRVLPKVIEALDSRPLSVRLKGLSCMKGSFAKARVLYAPVEEIGNENRLIRACQIIIDAYVKAGLVMERDAKQSLKMHATVMNARHRKRDKWTKKVDFFDARGIMEKYGSEEWGDYLIQEAHLSQRFAYDEKGYYHCCASIPFPRNSQLK